MPVVAVFLPVPVAVAITAVVHGLNKLLKLVLLWRDVDMAVVMRFGLPAMVAAVPGAMLLGHLSVLAPLADYSMGEHVFVVTPVKLVAGMLLIVFATAEQWPIFKTYALLRQQGQVVGGALSGFFGGLTGHQGAFRSAFLVQGAFSEKGYVATTAAIAAMVDVTRVLVYGATFDLGLVAAQGGLVAAATAASFMGVFLGSAYLAKVTMPFIQRLVAVMMYVLGALLCAGVI